MSGAPNYAPAKKPSSDHSYSSRVVDVHGCLILICLGKLMFKYYVIGIVHKSRTSLKTAAELFFSCTLNFPVKISYSDKILDFLRIASSEGDYYVYI